MKTYIAFLRGVNVGGHKKVPMQTLSEIISDLGFNEVKTYIQSGNIIFKTSENRKEIIATEIKEAINKQFGFEVPILIKTQAEVISILEKCPFIEQEKQKSYFAMLYSETTKAQKEALKLYSFPNESFVLLGDCIYIYSSVGYGNVKANSNFFEKKLKIAITTRNCNTLNKIITLANS